MNTNYQRRIKLIDSRLQGGLIVPLIILESVIVAVALTYMYFDYSALLEEYMYSIHRLGHEDFFLRLMRELVVVVTIMTFVNVLLLMIANSLWVRHIKSILSCFRHSLGAVKQLDLRSRPPCPAEHEVLTQLEQWRQREASRFTQLNEHLPQISSGSAAQRLRAIEEALGVLPKHQQSAD